MKSNNKRAVGVPSNGSFENWLRMLAIHRTGPDAPWWQVFQIYRNNENRQASFRWGHPPGKPERLYTSPLLEAKRYDHIIKSDHFVKTQADLAKEMGVSRVRITQVMNLLKLVPDIQECLLCLEDQKTIRFFSERRLRPLVQIEDPKLQAREFQKMLGQIQE